MIPNPDNGQPAGTGKLGDILLDMSIVEPQIAYRRAPHIDPGSRPVWRVRFDLAFDPSRCFGLEINDEIQMGRGEETAEYISLARFNAEELGVSRQHVLLRPTSTHLYVLDMGSTNGTWRNGQSIGVNTPYGLLNGDVLKLGSLELIVRIIKHPSGRTQALTRGADALELVSPLAHDIMSSLDLDEVLRSAINSAITQTGADEASIWLVDERTGDLYLEAEHGIKDEHIRRMRLPMSDTLAGKVIETGKPVRANASAQDEQIKVKTGYLVTAVVYVPLTLGGVTFGVLSAVHHQPDQSFSRSDEKILAAIAEFTAIAVQNARTYQSTARALTRREKVITALNYAHSYDFKNLVNAMIGYAGLLENYQTVDEGAADIIRSIAETGDHMSHLLVQLHEISSFGETPSVTMSSCNLISVTGRAVADLKAEAAARSIVLDLQFTGAPYPVTGDSSRLYRSVLHLVEQAIRFSPDGAKVAVTVNFTGSHVGIHVRDSGPAIDDDDLPYVFENYSRGGQSSEGQAVVELGLAFVWATVEAHRGVVEARSTGGEGAEFVITLPAILRVADSGDGRETRQR